MCVLQATINALGDPAAAARARARGAAAVRSTLASPPDIGKSCVCCPLCQQMVLKVLGGQMQHVKSLKLFRPLSAYTTHPRWQQLAGPDCSFAEACSLLDSGLAADFLDASMAADAQGAHA